MQEASTRKIYDVHAMFYDATFGRLVRRRIARAISHMPIRPDDVILDLGIGTGVSLDYYPTDRGRVIGVDLSSGMLRKAREKVRERGLHNAVVFQADAMRLPFADDTFDHVFMSHVISVVSDPYTLIQEAQRVAKPGGRIVMVNHFQSTNRFIALVEKWLCPCAPSWGGAATWRCRTWSAGPASRWTTATSWRASTSGRRWSSPTTSPPSPPRRTRPSPLRAHCQSDNPSAALGPSLEERLDRLGGVGVVLVGAVGAGAAVEDRVGDSVAGVEGVVAVAAEQAVGAGAAGEVSLPPRPSRRLLAEEPTRVSLPLPPMTFSTSLKTLSRSVPSPSSNLPLRVMTRLRKREE
jgi:phosphatidylethanolamine/phosphatidyl-N-methylethanolamine N-methyltransferase